MKSLLQIPVVAIIKPPPFHFIYETILQLIDSSTSEGMPDSLADIHADIV